MGYGIKPLFQLIIIVREMLFPISFLTNLKKSEENFKNMVSSTIKRLIPRTLYKSHTQVAVAVAAHTPICI